MYSLPKKETSMHFVMEKVGRNLSMVPLQTPSFLLSLGNGTRLVIVEAS